MNVEHTTQEFGYTGTAFVVHEARKRNITVIAHPEIHRRMVILKKEDHTEFMYDAWSDSLGYASYGICEYNKALTSVLLNNINIQTPREIITSEAAEAESFLRKEQAIVIKPIDGANGRGVTVRITDPAEISNAITKAQSFSQRRIDGKVLCQQYADGNDIRALVVGEKGNEQVFVHERIPPYVVGDGKQTVQELIEAENNTRMHEFRIRVNEATDDLLQKQRLSMDEMPQKEQRVQLQLVANTHMGGTIHDRTKETTPEIKEIAIKISRFFKLPLVGIDFITPDLTRDPGFVIEVNPTPDIKYPEPGTSETIASAIVDQLFPETAS